MKKEYLKPVATIYFINPGAIMDLQTSDVKGDTGGGEFEGGFSKDNGGSGMWEYMEDDED